MSKTLPDGYYIISWSYSFFRIYKGELQLLNWNGRWHSYLSGNLVDCDKVDVLELIETAMKHDREYGEVFCKSL